MKFKKLTTNETIKPKASKKAKIVLTTIAIIWIAVGTLAIALYVYEFVVSHTFRSPIIFQAPIVKNDLLSPFVLSNTIETEGKTPRVVESVTHQGDIMPLGESHIKTTPTPTKPPVKAIVMQDKDIPTSSVKGMVERATIEVFGETHVPAMHTLVFKESSYNHLAQNPKSTAFGLFQFLDQTWGNYGCEKTHDVDVQIECGIKYIKARYGNPTKAIEFHSLKGWY